MAEERFSFLTSCSVTYGSAPPPALLHCLHKVRERQPPPPSFRQTGLWRSSYVYKRRFLQSTLNLGYSEIPNLQFRWTNNLVKLSDHDECLRAPSVRSELILRPCTELHNFLEIVVEEEATHSHPLLCRGTCSRSFSLFN